MRPARASTTPAHQEKNASALVRSPARLIASATKAPSRSQAFRYAAGNGAARYAPDVGLVLPDDCDAPGREPVEAHFTEPASSPWTK